MSDFRKVAPILPVRDVVSAADHYRRLGFEVRAFGGDAPYAFAERGGVDLHLSQVDDVDPLTSLTSVYLYVDDADALAAEWRAAGVDGRMVDAQDTDYGLREGAHVDPDGNLLRFGSPLTSGA